MLIFTAIAIAAFIIVAGSFLFGHDVEHDVDHDHGDVGHDTDSGGGEPTISVFSVKVMGTLLMGFGAAGAIAKHYTLDYVPASLIGLLCGVVLGGLMYLVLEVFYKQQASSLVPTGAALGCTGTVTVSIGPGALGEVGITIQDQYTTCLASAQDGQPIPKGQTVRVVKTMGSQVVVQRTD
jgi:membrane protein implicated in regulation of membrane protease activity